MAKYIFVKKMPRDAIITWISHKAQEIRKKHPHMQWKTAIKEASAVYRKEHGISDRKKKDASPKKARRKHSKK